MEKPSGKCCCIPTTAAIWMLLVFEAIILTFIIFSSNIGTDDGIIRYFFQVAGFVIYCIKTCMLLTGLTCCKADACCRMVSLVSFPVSMVFELLGAWYIYARIEKDEDDLMPTLPEI